MSRRASRTSLDDSPSESNDGAHPMSMPVPTSMPSSEAVRNRSTDNNWDSLLAVLSEFAQRRDGLGPGHNPAPTDEDPVDIGDAELEKEKKQRFEVFESKIWNLDKVLEKITSEVRRFSSAVDLIIAAAFLRDHLSQVFQLVRIIVRPPTLERQKQKDALRMSTTRKPRVRNTSPRFKSKRQVTQQSKFRPVGPFNSDREALPKKLEGLARDLVAFENALQTLPGIHHVPDYTAEDVDHSFLSLEQDLHYWARNLSHFKGSFHLPALRRHVATIADEMVVHLDAVTDALRVFFEICLPTIKLSQQYTTDVLKNLSTVSTFFCTVSATTIQFSWTLVVYSSPVPAVPWWISIWATKTSLFFLIASVATFALGLICFAFSTFPHTRYIPVCVTAVAALSASSLFLVSLWFLRDYRTFRENKGSRHPRLGWILDRLRSTSKVYSGPKNRIRTFLGRRSVPGDNVLPIVSGIIEGDFLEHEREKEMKYPERGSMSGLMTPSRTLSMAASGGNALGREIGPRSGAESQVLSQFSQALSRIRANLELDKGSRKPIQRFREVVMKVVNNNRLAKEEWRMSLASIGPALKSLSLSHTMKEHAATIQDIKFSPDGDFLATCSWDQTAIVWRIGTLMQLHRMLQFQGANYPSRLAWASNNELLAVKLAKGYVIWNISTGKKHPPVNRVGIVQNITWMPDGKSLMCTEGTYIYHMDMDGTELWKVNLTYSLDEVVITPDGKRLLAVGTLNVTPDDEQLAPSRSRPERRIILFNIEERKTIHEMPTLNDVQGLSLSVSGSVLLVTHEEKTPPQLFRVNPTWLALLHTYPIPNAMEYAGSSQLGIPGPTFAVGAPKMEDQIIVCASIRGDFFIWDRESSRLLHSYRALIRKGSHLTGIAWNHGSTKVLMVASSSSDGTIRIWSSPWGVDGGSVMYPFLNVDWETSSKYISLACPDKQASRLVHCQRTQ
ncbi:quinon protein alcohol dehydrogenase-like superfamily [Cantharellus anzutake]|uniref:quinon protein alcohol dehydrogenase-like superfamily n=1 Tax=Cantharellus anzutake TaxID=1750568 RepID=UPI00190756FF|nr:quinon protein alcohol dehydrogenase-like superfamily [Cantharellus anzutake]KAF8339885.1 quinon protein alcohol dehydrogenase-like superfamily [Cantharellus anzutake]